MLLRARPAVIGVTDIRILADLYRVAGAGGLKELDAILLVRRSPWTGRRRLLAHQRTSRKAGTLQAKTGTAGVSAIRELTTRSPRRWPGDPPTRRELLLSLVRARVAASPRQA